MNILKTVLDFLLSVTRLFFRRKSGKRQFCPQCGSLLRADRPCICGRRPAGGSTGSSGCDDDPSPEPGEEDNQDPDEDEMPSGTHFLVMVAGWLLFASACISGFVKG